MYNPLIIYQYCNKTATDSSDSDDADEVVLGSDVNSQSADPRDAEIAQCAETQLTQKLPDFRLFENMLSGKTHRGRAGAPGRLACGRRLTDSYTAIEVVIHERSRCKDCHRLDPEMNPSEVSSDSD